MIWPNTILATATLVVVVSSGAIGYQLGYKVADRNYLKAQAEALQHQEEVSRKNADTDLAEATKLQERTSGVAQKIVRIKREIVFQPARDCGWTDVERMSVNAAYCAAFPDAPTCLSNGLSGSSGASRSP